MTTLPQRLRDHAEGNLREYGRELANDPHRIVTQRDMREAADLMEEAAREIERMRMLLSARAARQDKRLTADRDQ